MSIDPTAFWNGVVIKPYFGFNPYAVYCEPGAGTGVSSQCMQGSVIEQPNWEAIGCAMVADGNIWPGTQAAKANRSWTNVVVNSLYTSGGMSSIPAGGCAWVSYIDLFGMYGVEINDIWPIHSQLWRMRNL